MRTLVRRANEWDAPAMLKILAPYIGKSECTELKRVPTIAEYVNLIDKYTYGFGWVIAEIDGVPAGYAYLTEDILNADDPFSNSVKLFVTPDQKRRGIGSAMLFLLSEMMRYGNKKSLCSIVNNKNNETTRFFESQGFTIENSEMNKNIFRKKITAVEPNAMKVTKPFLIDSRDYEKARVFAGSMIKEK